MSLLEFCQWIQFSDPLVAMRSSPWLFPVIATIHLMGLAVIGGAVLLVTHDPHAADKASRAIRIEDGRLAKS